MMTMGMAIQVPMIPMMKHMNTAHIRVAQCMLPIYKIEIIVVIVGTH